MSRKETEKTERCPKHPDSGPFDKGGLWQHQAYNGCTPEFPKDVTCPEHPNWGPSTKRAFEIHQRDCREGKYSEVPREDKEAKNLRRKKEPKEPKNLTCPQHPTSGPFDKEGLRKHQRRYGEGKYSKFPPGESELLRDPKNLTCPQHPTSGPFDKEGLRKHQRRYGEGKYSKTPWKDRGWEKEKSKAVVRQELRRRKLRIEQSYSDRSRLSFRSPEGLTAERIQEILAARQRRRSIKDESSELPDGEITEFGHLSELDKADLGDPVLLGEICKQLSGVQDELKQKANKSDQDEEIARLLDTHMSDLTYALDPKLVALLTSDQQDALQNLHPGDLERSIRRREILTGMHGHGLARFQQFRVRADGNCLFRSVARQVLGNEEHHEVVRRLAGHQYRLATGYGGTPPDSAMHNLRGALYDQLQELSETNAPETETQASLETQLFGESDGIWGSIEAIQIIADTFDLAIYVHTANFATGSTQPTWTLTIRGNPNSTRLDLFHYPHVGHFQPGLLLSGPGSDPLALPLPEVQQMRDVVPGSGHTTAVIPPAIPPSSALDFRTVYGQTALDDAEAWVDVDADAQKLDAAAADEIVDDARTDWVHKSQKYHIPFVKKRSIWAGKVKKDAFKPLSTRLGEVTEALPGFRTIKEREELEALGREPLVQFGSKRLIDLSDGGLFESATQRKKRHELNASRRTVHDDDGKYHNFAHPQKTTRFGDDGDQRDITFDMVELTEPVLPAEEVRDNSAPSLIMVGRSSGPEDVNRVANCLMGHNRIARDWEQTRAVHRLQDPGLPLLPPAPEIWRLWKNDCRATDAQATYPNEQLTPEELQFITILDRIDARRPYTPPVYIIIRSLSGLSVAPQTFKRIRNRWPGLRIFIVFALRQPMIDHLRNVRDAQRTPPELPTRNAEFLLQANPSVLNMYYTKEININDLADYETFAQHPNPWIREVMILLQEEYDARSGGMPWEDARRVFLRDLDRNGDA